MGLYSLYFFLIIQVQGSENLPNLQSKIELAYYDSNNNHKLDQAEPVTVTIALTNASAVPVTRRFWVNFYLNPKEAPLTATYWLDIGSDLADPLGQQGISWYVEPLDKNSSVRLISMPEFPPSEYDVCKMPLAYSEIPDGYLGYSPEQSCWHGRFITGTTDLYSYADSYDYLRGAMNGLIFESNEQDNSYHLQNSNGDFKPVMIPTITPSATSTPTATFTPTPTPTITPTPFKGPAIVYLPLILAPLSVVPINGDFEQNLIGWATPSGKFNGHGTGIPIEVVTDKCEHNHCALIGIPDEKKYPVPIGYGSLFQIFIVQKRYLHISYHIYTHDFIFWEPKGYYFDTFEVSINKSPEQIDDRERNSIGCRTPPLNLPKILGRTGLVFCGGNGGNHITQDVNDLGQQEIYLDLENFHSTEITLYLTLWAREYNKECYEIGCFNTWVYLDNIQMVDNPD